MLPQQTLLFAKTSSTAETVSATQSIFMRNEMVDARGGGDKMFYRDVLIEDNVILNSHTHGITVGETHGLVIRNNTLLQNASSGTGRLMHMPTINIKAASTGVEVINNIVPRLALKSSSNATVENNLIVQSNSPGSENYYGRLFVDPMAGGSATLADLMAVPNGIIDHMGVGSSLTRFSTKSDAPTGSYNSATPVPLPAALPLFGSALAAIGNLPLVETTATCLRFRRARSAGFVGGIASSSR